MLWHGWRISIVIYNLVNKAEQFWNRNNCRREYECQLHLCEPVKTWVKIFNVQLLLQWLCRCQMDLDNGLNRIECMLLVYLQLTANDTSNLIHTIINETIGSNILGNDASNILGKC